jgi:predicted  nucleic acid-binding Zn-ribbon protein
MRSSEVEQLRTEVNYCRDRVALLRAKLYRWGLGTNARLQQLERELERAQQRLRDARDRPRT